MESKIVYFENPGQENTDEVLRIARQRAKELGIKTILVASTTGNTAVKAMEAFSGFRIIVVSHASGWHSPDTQEFTEENRKIVESKGGILLTATHVFGGFSRAMRDKFKFNIGDIVAYALRILGQGMKVVCEIAMMAADAGLVRTDEEVIAIAGDNRGADTAVILRPAHSHDFFGPGFEVKLKIIEILCKPRF